MAHTAATELRIEAICAIMRQRWFGKADREQLAAEWDVTAERVTDLAAIASKRMLAEVSDHDTIRAEGGLALRQIIRDAVESEDPKDRANAIKAIDIWSNVMGAAAPKKVEMSGAVSLDEIDELKRAAQQNECSSPESQKPSDDGVPNS